MSDQQDTSPESPTTPAGVSPTSRPTRKRRSLAFGAALVAAVGLGAGATSIAQLGRSVTFVKLDPAPVTAMADGAMVAVKGDVAELFGNKFILQDSSGRALVETGRHGERNDLVAKGEPVTVQGRFEHGFIHAVAITHKDGRSDSLDPPPPPPPRGAPGADGPPA